MKQKAQEVLRRIYFEMPVSDQADAALLALRGMGETEPQGSFDQRYVRAQLLIKARRYQDAVDDLGPLIDTAPPEKQLDIRLDLGAVLYHGSTQRSIQNCTEAECSLEQTSLLRLARQAWKWFQRHRLGVLAQRSRRMRLSETIALGEKRFVNLIEVDGMCFLIGSSAHSVTLIAQLPQSAPAQPFRGVLNREWEKDGHP